MFRPCRPEVEIGTRVTSGRQYRYDLEQSVTDNFFGIHGRSSVNKQETSNSECEQSQNADVKAERVTVTQSVDVPLEYGVEENETRRTDSRERNGDPLDCRRERGDALRTRGEPARLPPSLASDGLSTWDIRG